MAKNKTAQKLTQKLSPFMRTILGSKDLSVVVFIVAIMAIIIVPLPSAALDFLITISIALSVLIIFMVLYVDKPTEFSAFPTILLIVTLYRLALNVATTRMILTEGGNGSDSVSKIINSFGQFVVSGNYIIGIIVFTILVLVNLIVITNGATRVTEVRARFALDAMPGKQMAIDADLNAGLIKQEEARARREALQQEADFYGTMDGASKFVKGDAIASIIITLVNIIGGFLIGYFQYGLPVSESTKIFTILTIGDGLVGQIPALIIATATGIMTTRAAKSSGTNFASDIINQLISSSKILLIVGFILCLFATVLGSSFGFVGLFFLLIAWLSNREDPKSIVSLFENWFNKKLNKPQDAKSQANQEDIERHKGEKIQASEEEIKQKEEAMLNEALKLEMLEIHLGYDLMRFANKDENGDLIERVRSMRKQIASDYGFLIPQVRIRDNLKLKPECYNILLKNVIIGQGELMPNKLLALDTGQVINKIDGIETKEPAMGLDALWIDASARNDAAQKGYMTIEPPNIITTHLSTLIKKYAEEFITIDEVKNLMNKLSDKYPTVVAEAQKIPLSTIKKVLQNLLHEQIPIRDMISILETLIDIYPNLQNDISALSEYVRASLSRTITDLYKSDDGTLKAMTFFIKTEQFLLGKLKDQTNTKALLLSINETQTLVNTIVDEMSKIKDSGISPVVLLVDYRLRKALANLLEEHKLEVVVLGNSEIDPRIDFEILSTIDVAFT